MIAYAHHQLEPAAFYFASSLETLASLTTALWRLVVRLPSHDGDPTPAPQVFTVGVVSIERDDECREGHGHCHCGALRDEVRPQARGYVVS
jgi:hypothetical protein